MSNDVSSDVESSNDESKSANSRNSTPENVTDSDESVQPKFQRTLSDLGEDQSENSFAEPIALDDGDHTVSSDHALDHHSNDDSDDGSKHERTKVHLSDHSRSSSPPSERYEYSKENKSNPSPLHEADSTDDAGEGLIDIELSDSSEDDSEVTVNRNRVLNDAGIEQEPHEDVGEDEGRLEPAIVEVNTARICPNFRGDGLYFVKFPNFLSLESKPFDQEHYEDEFDEEDLMDEEGRARLKLRVENTIRWRYELDADNSLIRQGNSKIVRWSDGTMSLYLGSEIFDVMVQPMQHDNHLFLRQGAGLQGHAVFKEKLIFRPHSTDSVTHRKVTLSMADRSNKSQRVKVLSTISQNPESQKAELVKREEERLRAQNRREAQQRRSRVRPIMRSGLSSNFLEERDEDSGESIAAIKNRYKYGYDNHSAVNQSDSDVSDSRRLNNAKNDSDGSESEQEVRKRKKIIIDDEDD